MFVGHTVLDLKYFAYLYVFFGLNQKSLHSIGPRISTLYSIILTSFIMYCVIFRFAKISVLSRYLTGIEYFVNVLVSLLTGDEYINQYWINAYTIDSSSAAKKQLKKLSVFAIVGLIYIVIYRVYSCYVFCQTTPPTCESFELLIIIFIHIANDLRRISILLNIVLLYFRSKVMRMALNSLDIKDTNRNTFAVNRLIQMYETLVDSLKYIGFPFKVTVVNCLFCAAFKTIFSIVTQLLLCKQYDDFKIDIPWLFISGHPLFFFLTLALVMDLTADNFTNMQINCAEKIMLCTNERDRFGLERLLLLFKHRPLRHTMMRISPISVRTLLSCLFFVIVNIIAVLQIKNFYA